MIFKSTESLPAKNITALLLQIMCVCWFFEKLISRKIWTTYRLLPTAPVFDFLNAVPPFIHGLLFIASLCMMMWLIFKPGKYLMTGLLATEILSCLLDQNRWQPWEYQYLFILLAYIINTRNPKHIAAMTGFILAATYFYGGLSKFNPGFLHQVWYNLGLRFFFTRYPYILNLRWLYYCGYLFALMEAAAGIGLLFKQTRAKSAIVLIAFHLVVLWLIGPIGNNINRVVWPWSLVLILFLYLLFLRDKELIPVLEPVSIGWNKMILLFLGILPACSFAGWWDKELSANLYPGNAPQLNIGIQHIDQCKSLQPFCFPGNNSVKQLNLIHWAYAETNTPGYASKRVYQIIQHKMEVEYPAAGLTFVYDDGDNP